LFILVVSVKLEVSLDMFNNQVSLIATISESQPIQLNRSSLDSTKLEVSWDLLNGVTSQHAVFKVDKFTLALVMWEESLDILMTLLFFLNSMLILMSQSISAHAMEQDLSEPILPIVL
jgi:hypothetical protein